MMIHAEKFRSVFVELFDEVFDGVRPDRNYTYVVQGREGLMAAFEDLTAEQASYRVPGCSSVAAHLDHARYYIRAGNRWPEEEGVPTDWEGSWANQTVDEAGWQKIKEGLEKERLRLLSRFNRPELDLDDEDVLRGCLANLIHAGFHLGAARSLVRAALAAG